MFKNRKKIIIATSTAFLVCMIVATLFVFKFPVLNLEFVKPTSLDSKITIQTTTEPDFIETKILSFGDVFLGRRVENWSLASELKYAYPFSGLDTFEKNNYDAWIANLECPVTDSIATKYEQETLLKFNCRPEFIEESKKWFEVFSIANNHTDNMEEVDGLNQTRSFLEKNGIQYFGHYDNAVKEDICEVISIDARGIFDSEDTAKRINDNVKIPFAFCGYHNVFKRPTQDEIDVISMYSKYFPTIIMPHMGVEYETVSDGLKQEVYRQYIDAGADLVLGGHPHSVQETEVYNGKLIVYSLGNFIFDQQGSDLVTQGIGVVSKFQFVNNENFNLVLGKLSNCSDFKDDCLKVAEENNISKPEFKIQYDLVPTNNSNKLTKKGSESDLQKMLEITNWNNSIEKLNQ